ncbi:putative glutathione-specific gamma-glutamylcyclotransferase 2 [Artemia franciscana]|uniref:putative glutathione-specific gamma-glutamylcyclotransferase 2 n=1 Tax=Artemia franciscana TaxID=6661 RepID=UPI0032DA436F
MDALIPEFHGGFQYESRAYKINRLVPEKVWGIAYEIAEEDEETVRNHLDYREKGGYQRYLVDFYPEDGNLPFPLEIYLGTTDNPFFIGPSTVEEVAEVIVKAKGPSGENTEYLFGLARALRELGPDARDHYVFELEEVVIRLSSRNTLN